MGARRVFLTSSRDDGPDESLVSSLLSFLRLRNLLILNETNGKAAASLICSNVERR